MGYRSSSPLGGKARIVDYLQIYLGEARTGPAELGDLMYTWQYDVRWAGQVLRNKKY